MASPATVADAGRALRSGACSSVELTRSALARADVLDGVLGAYVTRLDVYALAAAERADAEARSVLAAAPDRAPIEQARRDHRALDDASTAHRAASEAADTAAAALASASTRAAEAGAHVEHARAERAVRLRADLVAALRPNLVVGQEWDNDVRVVLFVRLREGATLNEALRDRIRRRT